MSFRSLHRLTLLGLVFFILGLAGVAFALIKIYGSDGATDPALMRSLLVAAGMQLTGYVLLNRNRFRAMSGKPPRQ